MENKMQWEKLAEYFAGELTEKEKQEMEVWIKSDPERERKVYKLQKVWQEFSKAPEGFSEINVDEVWDKLSDQMDKLDVEKQIAGRVSAGQNDNRSAEGLSRSSSPIYTKSKKIKRRIMMVAAAAVVIAGLFGYYNFAEFDALEVDKSEKVAIQEFKAQKGERATYVLSDGSRVMLHAESSLEVPISFTGDTREVYLEGEAYFEVADDAERPFTIRSEQSYTRVLGTKFLVQAWPDKSPTEVVVAEGKVAFGKNQSADDREEIILTNNQKGVLNNNQLVTAADVKNIDWYMGWTTGKLVFENRPIKEVIPKLERWYALDIQFETESIGNKRLSAEIDYSQPMDEVLGGIALSLELEMNRTGRAVTYSEK